MTTFPRVVYKIVSVVNSKLYSMAILYPLWKLEYPIGTWVQARKGKIFVFETFEQVTAFIQKEPPRYVPFQVWACEYEGLTTLEKLAKFYSEDDIEAFWNYAVEGSWTPPKGTCLVDRLKLVTLTLEIN